MAAERVRMWRPIDEGRVLLMEGMTTDYAIEPRGEYVFGIVAHRPMRAQRGSERRLVRPGELVAWGPSSAHRGTALDGEPWASRLMVVELASLESLANDLEGELLADVAFPEPVVSDPELAARFVELHAALDAPASRLERDELLAEWLRALISRPAAVRAAGARPGSRDDRAFRAACAYLADRPERNVGLQELADAAGMGKFRLIRLFRDRTGLPPHAFQIAHRVRAARRLLEAGRPIAETARATGFVDQSHLHRQFQRSLGLTPGAYRARFEQ
jgi:AraC-like DNA-binding protein